MLEKKEQKYSNNIKSTVYQDKQHKTVTVLLANTHINP